MPPFSLQSPLLLRALTGLVLASLAGAFALAVPPDQRTIYDSWIADSQYQQKTAEREKYWASRPGPAQYQDYTADLAELNAQSRLQAQWAADEAQMRARRAARDAAQQARDEETRAILALYDRARAGNADALMTVGQQHESSSYHNWGLHEYELVFGPRRSAALWRMVEILRRHAHEPEELRSFRSVDSYLAELAGSGDTQAARQLAEQRLGEGDYFEAARYFTQAGSAGDAGSRRQAIALVAGDRVDTLPLDPATFHRWCEAASAEGDVAAQLAYGCALARGDEIARDPAKGLAQFRLAIAQAPRVTLAPERLLCAEAAEQAGLMLRDGRGLPANPAEGLRLLELAAEWGSVTAQLELGRSALLGLGAPADLPAAIARLTRAAERENAEAASLLGVAYLRPDASDEEIDSGLLWLKRAAKRRPDAMIRYGTILYDGSFGVAADPEEARSYFGRALQHYPSDRDVLEFIGAAYVAGDFGLRPSRQEGVRLLKVAAARGSVRAADRLAQLGAENR